MRVLAGAFLVVFLLVPAVQAQTFPELTGRVVDGAGILDSSTERDLTARLAAHEQASSNQVVVVTVPGLEGYEIADYGYRLGRHWGIGQQGRDNGVLLLVAPQERKVRIEVGYGLEGDLPDATAKLIIENEIIPAFKAGDMQRGIVRGADAILAAIDGAYDPLPRQQETADEGLAMGGVMLMFFMFVLFQFFRNEGRVGRRGRRGVLVAPTGGFGGGGFGGGGGGFGGGGGGFGGGGSSGGW
ncbi:TPM domain-containing protein [Minwuia sp.]|uniref:TPM domain-containing protein n=1 Tax=Minwuia sp. TaxID=2493630 RepID=UPI003A93CC39